MTKRERYLKALRNESVDQLVWAPNFDYWLHVNSAEGTIPAKYYGMSRNDIVRAVNGYIWNRVSGLKVVYDGVEETCRTEDDLTIHEFITPIGTVREVYVPTEEKARLLS